MEYLIVELLGWARERDAEEISLNFCVFGDLLAESRATGSRPSRVRYCEPATVSSNSNGCSCSAGSSRPSGAQGISASNAARDLLLVGMAYLRVESLLTPPGPWARQRATAACPPRVIRHTEAMAQPATRNLGRLSEIAQVAVRHGFGYWFDTHRLTDLFPRRSRRGGRRSAVAAWPASP